MALSRSLRLIGSAAAVEGHGILGVGRDQRRAPFDLEVDILAITAIALVICAGGDDPSARDQHADYY
jgi:hypothetical protein